MWIPSSTIDFSLLSIVLSRFPGNSVVSSSSLVTFLDPSASPIVTNWHSTARQLASFSYAAFFHVINSMKFKSDLVLSPYLKNEIDDLARIFTFIGQWVHMPLCDFVEKKIVYF